MTRPPRFSPAALKDGRYVKPCGELEVGQLWCGRRQVWTASNGTATRYHVMVDRGLAACRSRQAHRWQPFSLIMLCELIPIAEVPANLCCLRNGCRQVYEAFLA